MNSLKQAADITWMGTRLSAMCEVPEVLTQIDSCVRHINSVSRFQILEANRGNPLWADTELRNSRSTICSVDEHDDPTQCEHMVFLLADTLAKHLESLVPHHYTQK
jgi:hypothetical protein